MKSRAQIRLLPAGRRLHMNDGPIDLIVEAFGPIQEIEKAYVAASGRFVTVLDEVCDELAHLRRRCAPEADWPRGCVAGRMMAAVMPYAAEFFITPMAAVAGAVAEEILACMVAASDLSRAYVNDGGDIALHLAAREEFVVGMVERPDCLSVFGTATITANDPIRGIATSGWRGRSFSLGIADSVAVLADRAAAADAAATIIANAVDLPGHPAIVRVPACDLAPDSDLGDRLVTQAVGRLTNSEVDDALDAGVLCANRLLKIGLIRSAALSLQEETRVVGSMKDSIASVRERNLVHA
ncbi:MAG TPA: hypothetical protein VHW45_19330 [Candidatus Sulfotelmatobacter sp.]|nr:hypothetical protein [Candidatus Sulfotelmatobacter sp.]